MIALLLTLLLISPAIAHDFWINGKRNGAGEWCCGAGDCALMDPKSVAATSRGYVVNGWGTIEGSKVREFYHESVPEPEAMPSPDGQFWRCKRPDGSRRCFFAPPPNT